MLQAGQDKKNIVNNVKMFRILTEYAFNIRSCLGGCDMLSNPEYIPNDSDIQNSLL